MLGKLGSNGQREIAARLEEVVDTAQTADIRILDVQRTYRPENREADHLRLIYSIRNSARELTISVPWESTALIRSELDRLGYTVNDEDILGLIVVHWAVERIADGANGMPNATSLTLEFGDGPRPHGVHELLIRAGYVPSEQPSSMAAGLSWMWEG